MKLSEQGRFELRIWLAERAHIASNLIYVYDQIKDWDIDDIDLYKRLVLGEGTARFMPKITKEEHVFIVFYGFDINNSDWVHFVINILRTSPAWFLVWWLLMKLLLKL